MRVLIPFLIIGDHNVFVWTKDFSATCKALFKLFESGCVWVQFVERALRTFDEHYAFVFFQVKYSIKKQKKEKKRKESNIRLIKFVHHML